MKKLTFIFALCSASFSLKAQSNLLLNGDMTGTSLNYVNVNANVSTPAAGAGWAGYYGSLRPLNIVSTIDDDTNSGQGDIIQLTATGANTDIANNPRLVQRTSSTPVGVYRLKFKAKATTSNTTTVIPTVRSSANNVPGYVLKEYDGTGIPTHQSFVITNTWMEYIVDYDLSKTASALNSSAIITSGITASQYPAICFSLQCSATEATAGVGVMIDDVSFISLSTTPIELISFNGKVDKFGNSALLEWKTASNSLMKFIDVEKSIDGISFSKINTVNPKEDKNYSYTDKDFNRQNAYYRLNQTDIDGTISYSPIIYLKYDHTGSLSIFPNPASDKIVVSHPKSVDSSTLKIISSTGQNVYTSKINALDSQTTIDIQNLSSGIYLVVLESGKDKQYLKFIK